MSKFSSLLPLIITLFLVIAAAVIGFVAYAIVTAIRDETSKKMEKKNIHFSRDGMKVGVKEVSTESYTDRTQNMLVKVWNNASWPAYKSRLGWGQWKEQQTATPSPAKRGPNGSTLTPTQSSQSLATGTEHRSP